MSLGKYLKSEPTPLLTITEFRALVGPVDGQTVRVWIPASVTGAVDDVIWTVQYRALNPLDATANGNTHKWEVVDYQPMYTNSTAADSYSPGGGGAWQSMSPVVELTAPLTGIYAATISAYMNPAIDNTQAQIGVSVAGVDPVTATIAGAANVFGSTAARVCRVGAVTRAQTMRLKFRDMAASGTASVSQRMLDVWPVRVDQT